MSPTLTLYGTPTSGHTHRVEALLSMLGLPYVYREAPAKVRDSAAFQKLNPLGQIPVLVDHERVFCDSGAIMIYLVQKYAPDSGWLPTHPAEAAQVYRWLFIAAGELRYGPAEARGIWQWNWTGEHTTAKEISANLLRFMEQHLTGRKFLALDHPTLADLACYGYIAHAPEGGISLASCPNIRGWLKRVEALPNFKLMPDLPIPSAAKSSARSVVQSG
ncbi:glutathione S-transferase [Betaproteobacteria bacterium]|nr:glutathione S-transferase [Betaproteobacteria bacterium]GHU46319.1 glutathione S-transferase [Betaproteobacteria bacterium]